MNLYLFSDTALCTICVRNLNTNTIASVKFYLDNPTENGKQKKFPVSLYVYLTINRKERIKVNTGMKVLPRYWKQNRIIPQAPYSTKLNNKISEWENEIYALYSLYGHEPQAVLRDRIKNIFTPKAEDNTTILSVLDTYIERSKPTLTANTIKIFNTLKRLTTEIIDLHPEYNYWQKLDWQFFDDWQNYLYSQDGKYGKFLDHTVHKYTVKLKSFLRWARKREYPVHPSFEEWVVHKFPKVEQVVLTPEEVIKVMEKPLIGTLDQIRDLFIFLVFTGQRWSDLERFNKRQIIGNAWVLEQKKGETRHVTKVTIPFVGVTAIAKKILEKYDYHLPKVTNQHFNREIKEVCKQVGLTEIVSIKRKSGRNIMLIENPKHEFITAHSARRTCVTMLLASGMNPSTVMQLTGHKDIDTLMQYNHEDQKELVKALQKIKIG